MGKRIAIATIGTMGDVQPFVALALRLQERGYSVVIGTTGDFEDFVTGRGIDFYNLGSDIQAFLRQSQFDKAMSKSMLLYAPALLRQGQRILREAGRQVWAMSQDADAIVFHMNTTFAIDIAEALDIPAIMTAFQPLNPTGEFPYFAYDGPPLDPIFNRLSYVVQSAQQTYYDLPRDRIRSKLLGLKRRRLTGFGKDNRGKNIPTLHAYSPSISPRPRDWPPSAKITGFWRLEDDSDWSPSPEFRAFLDEGEPPVYLGFGSMPFGARRNTEIITQALNRWGGRAVIAQGWGGLSSEDLPRTIFSIAKAPHTELFKYVKAVVHHGGAGTTYAGLYAGRPTFIVPQFFDQPYWGRRVHELGCGPAPVRLRKLTANILANALANLVGTPAYQRNTTQLQQKLHEEDGTARAVDMIERTIAAYPFQPDIPQTRMREAYDRAL